jgi:hypothetical protein
MENKKLYDFMLNKYEEKFNEDDDIEAILNSHKKLRNSQIMQNLDISKVKSLDWLNFFFQEPEMKDLYTNNERINNILIIQAIYYLNIFKTLYLLRFRIGKGEHGETKDELPMILTRSNISNTNPGSPLRRSGSLPKIPQSKSQFASAFLNNPPIPKQKQSTKTHHKSESKMNTYFKIGIIGCGRVGSFLLKHLIHIKDSGKVLFHIIVSTRRPSLIDTEIQNNIDDQVEILLDNEKVFLECDLIFLCIQPHQLDLLCKDVLSVFNDRIEKLKKKKIKIFPTLVSFLCAVPVEKLRQYFSHEEVNIQRTYIHPKIVKEYNYMYKDLEEEIQSSGCDKNSRMITINSIAGDNNLIRCDTIPNRGGIIIKREIVNYLEEAFYHLFKTYENSTCMGSNESQQDSTIYFSNRLINSYHKAFFIIRVRQENKTYKFYPEFTFSPILLRSILGETFTEIYNISNNSFTTDNVIEVVSRCKDNFIKICEGYLRISSD